MCIRDSHRTPTTEADPMKTAGKAEHQESQKKKEQESPKMRRQRKEPAIKRNVGLDSKNTK